MSATGKRASVTVPFAPEDLAKPFEGTAPLIATQGSDGVVRVWRTDGNAVQVAAFVFDLKPSTIALCSVPIPHNLLVASGIGSRNTPTLRFVDCAASSETVRSRDVLEFPKEHNKSSRATVLCLADGRIARSSFQSRSIAIVDPLAGQVTRELELQAPLIHMALLPDAQVASSSRLGVVLPRSVETWNTGNGQRETVLETKRNLQLAYFLPDRRLVCSFAPDDAADASGSAEDSKVSAAERKTLFVYDLKAGQRLYSLDGHRDAVSALCLLPNHVLATGSSREIRLWRLGKAQANCEVTLPVGDVVEHLTCLSNGQLASNVAHTTSIQIWSLGREPRLAKCVRTLELPNSLRLSTSAALSSLVALPGARVAALNDHWLKVWHCETGRCEATFSPNPRGAYEFLSMVPLCMDKSHFSFVVKELSEVPALHNFPLDVIREICLFVVAASWE